MDFNPVSYGITFILGAGLGVAGMLKINKKLREENRDLRKEIRHLKSDVRREDRKDARKDYERPTIRERRKDKGQSYPDTEARDTKDAIKFVNRILSGK